MNRSFVISGLVALCCLIGCSAAPKKVDNTICMAPLGTYKMVVQGVVPPDGIGLAICPAELYVGEHQEAVITLARTDPRALCGTHVDELPGGSIAIVKTTRSGMSGEMVMPIRLANNITCHAFFKITFEKLADDVKTGK